MKKVYIEKGINFLFNILILIFSIILLISIYTWIQAKVLRNKYTDFFGYSFFEVQTNSMAETINAGDWIIVKLTKRVKLNDVITYELGDDYVTHRIVEVRNGTYITSGDNNNTEDDAPVNREQIVGKVVKVLPHFGIFRRTLFNLPVLIALIITLYLFNMMVKKNKEEGGLEVYKNDKKPLFTNDVMDKVVSFFGKVKEFINEKIVNKLVDKLIAKRLETMSMPKEGLDFYEKDDNSRFDVFDQINKKEENSEKPALYYQNVLENEKEMIDKIETDLGKEENIPKITNNEEDLEKTALYRVISVNLSDKEKDVKVPVPMEEQVVEKVEEESKPTEEVKPIATDVEQEEDLEKTMLFRVISVDLSDREDTLLEIAQNEMNKPEKVETVKKEEKEVKEEIEEKEEESLTNINLDLLKTKKSKNVIEAAMNIIKEEINELIDCLIEDNKIYTNVPTITKTFIDAYVNARYYNYYGEEEVEGGRRIGITKIEALFKDIGNKLIKSYRGTNKKYELTVNTYTLIFILIARLRYANETITELKVKKEYYKKELTKCAEVLEFKRIDKLTDSLIKIQRKYSNMLKAFLTNLETNMFNLQFNKLSSKKDMYGLELKHNLTFSKVYSEYIIDKTYNEGVIAEDKISVLLTLLSIQLVKDMTIPKFNNKYLLYIPNSLYAKERKLEKALKMIDDNYARNNVVILINYGDLVNNAKVIKNMRRMGYKFAVAFDKPYPLKKKNQGNVYVADYIFVNKKTVDVEELKAFIPNDLTDKIFYEDVVSKVGDIGGE